VLTRGNYEVTTTPEITVYTLEVCPNCELLKLCLKKLDVSYNERDMAGAEALTDLRLNGVFAMEAPVFQVNNQYFESKDIFENGNVNESFVANLVKGE